VAAPGNSAIANGPSVIVGSSFNATQSHNCGPVGAPPPGAPAGEVVSVSFVGDTSTVLAQVREPAGLWRSDTQQTIPLATDSFADTGHALFHADAGSGIACASCHPEGGDDGRVWNFTCMGARRTQSLRGGIMGTAPFHWDGVENDFARLTEDVFEGRMSGPLLNVEQKTAMQAWIDTIPALPARRGLDAAAVERGHALFDDKKVGCATCHAGALLTNNQTVDIGIGPATQVPSLRGITWRAPFMHTGCARSLVDRFDPACGGRADRHGATSSLSPGQLGDLVMYLESL
jgi:cytochrome c peroxidase